LFPKKDTTSCSYLGKNVWIFSCPIKYELTMDREMVVNCCRVFFGHSPESMEEQRKPSAFFPCTFRTQVKHRRLNRPPRLFRLTSVFTLDFTTSDRSKAMLQVFIYFHKSVTVFPQSSRGTKENRYVTKQS